MASRRVGRSQRSLALSALARELTLAEQVAGFSMAEIINEIQASRPRASTEESPAETYCHAGPLCAGRTCWEGTCSMNVVTGGVTYAGTHSRQPGRWRRRPIHRHDCGFPLLWTPFTRPHTSKHLRTSFGKHVASRSPSAIRLSMGASLWAQCQCSPISADGYYLPLQRKTLSRIPS